MLRAVLVAAVLALGLVATLPAQGAAAGSCSTKDVGATGYRIVRLQASGMSCTKARSTASIVAKQLHATGGLDLPGIAGLSMSTETCTGCSATTQIELSYSSGAKVTIALRRSGGTAAPSSPSVPTTTAPGTGTLV